MIFLKAGFEGVWIVEPQLIEDERGFFSRCICEKEFAEHGLLNQWVQQNIAFNHKRGTLRGLHYQKGDAAEIKVVRCTRGAIFDVIVDLREGSSTYKKWFGIELSVANHKMIYIPKGFAHGYITLTDQTEIFYLVSSFYKLAAENGIRYDDPSFDIKWPENIKMISEKDDKWPLFK